MGRRKPPKKPYIGQPYQREVVNLDGTTRTVWDTRIRAANGQPVFTSHVQGYENYEDAMTPLLHLASVPIVVKDADGNVIPSDVDPVVGRKRRWFRRR